MGELIKRTPVRWTADGRRSTCQMTPRSPFPPRTRVGRRKAVLGLSVTLRINVVGYPWTNPGRSRDEGRKTDRAINYVTSSVTRSSPSRGGYPVQGGLPPFYSLSCPGLNCYDIARIVGIIRVSSASLVTNQHRGYNLMGVCTCTGYLLNKYDHYLAVQTRLRRCTEGEGRTIIWDLFD